MKKFLDKLVKKYWKDYEKDIIGCGFSWTTGNQIKTEINSYLDSLVDHYNIEEYDADSDEYVKFFVRREILTMIAKEIEKYDCALFPTPKRFYHSCGPRD